MKGRDLQSDVLIRLADINRRRDAEIAKIITASTWHYALCVIALTVSAGALLAHTGV